MIIDSFWDIASFKGYMQPGTILQYFFRLTNGAVNYGWILTHKLKLSYIVAKMPPYELA